MTAIQKQPSAEAKSMRALVEYVRSDKTILVTVNQHASSMTLPVHSSAICWGRR